MSESEKDPFEIWEDTVFDAVKSLSPSSSIYSEFNAAISRILKKRKLKSPNEEFTEHFVVVLCTKVINCILSSRPPPSNAEILNPFLKVLIPLFAKRLNRPEDDFLRSARSIICDPKTKFYRFTSSPNYYLENVDFFSKCGVLNDLTLFIKQNEDIEIEKIIYFIFLFNQIKQYCSKIELAQFFEMASSSLQDRLQSLDDKDIRSINEKDVVQAVVYIKQIIAKDSKENIENLDLVMFVLAIRFAKSPFLNKQFSGLSIIRTMLTAEQNPRKLCIMLNDEQIISFLLNDLHRELVGEFSDIFRIMLQYNFATPEDLQQFWSLAIKQHPVTVIDQFLKPFENLMSYLTKKMETIMWSVFCESDEYPIPVLQFFQRIANRGSDKKRLLLYNALTAYYSKKVTENDVFERNTLTETMCALVPENPKICASLQQQCFEKIKEGSDFGFFLALFKASCKCVTPAKAKECFCAVIKLMIDISNDESVQFLDLLIQLIGNFEEPFSDEEFNDLLAITLVLVLTNKEEILSLYKAIFATKEEDDEFHHHNLIPEDKIMVLFGKLCEMNPPVFSVIVFLFEEANSKYFRINSRGEKIAKSAEQLNGIENLWNLNFTFTEKKEIPNYLCFLYSHSKELKDVSAFMKRCLKHIDKLSTFIAISSLMEAVENKFDKLSYGIHENKFLTKLDSYEIQLSGYITQTAKVPKNLTFDAFYERVAYLAKLNRKEISLLTPNISSKNNNKTNNNNGNFNENSKNIKNEKMVITKRNFSIFDDMIVEIKQIPSKNFEKEFSKNYFPSLYLSKPKNFKLIFQFVKSNNKEFAQNALNIVNRLPTSKSENERICSLTEKRPNWSKIFSMKHQYLFLYRLNIIGSLLQKDNEWADSFYMSGGSQWLLNTLLTDSLSVFTSDEDLQLIMEISSLLLYKIGNKKLKKKMITSLGKDIIKHILEISLQHKNTNTLLVTLFGIIAEFVEILPNIFSDSDSFMELFDFSIFHKSRKIRQTISKVVYTVTPAKLLNHIVKLLPNAVDKNCDEFFELLEEVTDQQKDTKQFIKHSKQLLKHLEKTLFNKYSLDDESLSNQLLFIPPKEKFTKGFFRVFLKIILKQDVGEAANLLSSKSREEIFHFIVNDILFSKFKYFNPTKDMFDLMNEFLNQSPKLANSIIPKISEQNELQAPSLDGEFIFAKHRGIKNLGATCYMNATIQQLFNIHCFRDFILKSHENEDTLPEWFIKFQFVFAKLLLFPTNYIDISQFVKCWKWYEDPVNPHEQQDAVEFVQMLIDRLGELVPEVLNLFQGEITHETVGIDVNFHSVCKEKFVTFPLEINGHKNVDESFQTFLMPDIFEGNEQYDAGEGIGKINVKRYHSISKSPPILILQLKRFAFDLKTGKRVKLNNEYIFPREIDLKKVMKDKFDQNSQIYDLIGVEMHSGDAGGGHYFSFTGSQNAEWFKFDDMICKKFNPLKLNEVASGGQKTISGWNPDTEQMEEVVLDKSANAYLLYYQKRDLNINININNVNKIDKIDNVNNANDDNNVININNTNNVNNNPNDGLVEIDEGVIQKVADEVEGLVKTLIMKNEMYSNFLMSIADASPDAKFVYDFLMNSLKMARDQDQKIKILKKMNNMLNEEISRDFLNEKGIYNEFLMKSEKKEIRKIYSETICTAIDKANVVEPYLEFLESAMPKSIKTWTHFDEFLLPFVHILEKTHKNLDIKKWSELLVNFLKQSLANANNNQIYSLIKLDALYKALNLLFNDESIRNSFEATFFDTKFLKILFLSRRNSQSLSQLIRKFLINEEKEEIFYEKITNFIDIEEVSVICGIFATFLNFDKNDKTIKYLINFLKDAGNVENEEFLCDLVLRVPYIQMELVPFLTTYSNSWIIMWLLNVDPKIREECCDLVHKVFSDFPPLSFIDVDFNVTSGRITSLQNIANSLYYITKRFVKFCINRIENNYKLNIMGVDTFHMLPYHDFYDLLKWSIVRTNSISIILKRPKLLVNGMVKFKKAEHANSELCFSSLKFIHSVVGTKNSKEFFKKKRFARKFVRVFSDATFDSINRATSIETVSMIVSLLPPVYSFYLFRTQFFKNSLQYCFSVDSVTAPLLENYIIANARLKEVAPFVWSDEAFNRNYSNSNYFLSLTASLLNSDQKLSNLFFDLGRPKEILAVLVKDNEFCSVAAKQIEALAAFLRAYQQNGKHRDNLISLMLNMRDQIRNMLEVSKRTDVEYIKTDVLLAIYKILMQLFVMAPEFENLVFEFVQNGLLANAREDVWSGAIELVKLICVNLNLNQKENKAFSLVKNELLSLKKPYNFKIVVELCDVITKLLIQYEPPVGEIVDFLEGIRVDGTMPNPMPKEIRTLIVTLKDKESKGITKLVELAGARE